MLSKKSKFDHIFAIWSEFMTQKYMSKIKMQTNSGNFILHSQNAGKNHGDFISAKPLNT